MIVLAPASAQEMYDFVDLSFELAFKYRNPAMILSDGVIGQMMEKVELRPMKPRWTNGDVKSKAIVHLVDTMRRTEDGKIYYTRSKPVTTVGLTAEAKVLSPAEAYREYKILSTPMSWGTK
jgi:pyruvate/2-oxoacid:ferredoxin oxidoreductase alpha subunit